MRLFRLAALLLIAVVICPKLEAGNDPVCPFPQDVDPGLQRGLQSSLSTLELEQAARRGRLAVTLLVLTDSESPRLAQVNGERMFYAASLPKIAILLGAAVAIEDERVTLTPALEEDIIQMIRLSCNDCANRVIDAVGKSELVNMLQSPRYRFYDGEENGGLWIGKPFGSQPAWQRDPLNGYSHGATTNQAARFYCGLHLGTLVKPEQNALMLEALSQPGINHKLVKGLEGIDDLELFRKSGTWKEYHADSMLVREADKVYIMVALTRSPNGEQWLQSLARPLHDLATGQTD